MGATYEVAIMGAGRLGQSLGRLLVEVGHRMTMVSCRSREAAERAVAFVGAGQPLTYEDSYQLLPSLGETVIVVTTPDQAIAPMAERLAACRQSWRGLTVLHCSGALSSAALHVLRQRGAQTGSMHPLYAFGQPTANRQHLAGVHWTIEGDGAAMVVARRLVADLHGQGHEIPSEHKVLYHAAASLAGNHLTGLLSISLSLLERCGIAPAQARAMLVPLSEGVLKRFKTAGPVAALAGPISRGDTRTVGQHLEKLRELPPLYLDVYRALGLQLVELARLKGAPAAALADIVRLLHSISLPVGDGSRIRPDDATGTPLDG